MIPKENEMKKILSGLAKTGCGQLFTRSRPVGRGGKILQFPLSRIVLAVLFIVPPILLHNLLMDHFISKINKPLDAWIIDLEMILLAVAIFLCFRLYTRWIENREACELSLPACGAEFGSGELIALALVGIMVLLLALPGFYHVSRLNSWPVLAHSFFIFGTGALIQELVFRLVIFRLLEELLGTWMAMGAIAAIFGFVHLGNPNATLWTSLGLVLSDVLLSAAFILTRRIWLVWGIHAGWNYFQAGVFGMANSGITFKSWIVPRTSGPAWLSGGAFGIEASVVAVLLNLAVGIYLLKLAYGQRQFVKPAWMRR
jgi:membrane protease YdiL (CAAX protease family)